ncbi:MAG: hypothetical protein J07HQX50_00117, partial [Haloquadratum sp. J07HQX50]
MLASGQVNPEPLITDRIGLEETVDQGFNRLT